MIKGGNNDPSEEKRMKIFGISGSLRTNSFNSAALRTCEELLPDGVEFRRFGRLAEIPPYNEDLRVQGFPDCVEELRREIAEADALIIATPEYNYSVPGVLKNAIDWVSRPPQPLDERVVGIIGASKGIIGTARAQYHLRQTFVYLNASVLNRPEVFITAAHEKFDEGGTLRDTPTRDILELFVRQLVERAGRRQT